VFHRLGHLNNLIGFPHELPKACKPPNIRRIRTSDRGIHRIQERLGHAETRFETTFDVLWHGMSMVPA
jgi:hypothetical protein